MKLVQLPSDVRKILLTLQENGFEAYIVGGCVRDVLMGIEPHDWDITTSAKPEEIKRCFSHTADTGIAHGTVTVIENKVGYEVTTYRIDGEYKDCRHPENVLFTRNLAEDLLRRDFTMNAIAYNEQEGYVDLFGGMQDIQKKQIKGVGDPNQRFCEDALRMLRAVRFACQLCFEIEPATKKALCDQSVLIQKISVERIREELWKLLQACYLEKMPLLWETGLLYEVDPLLAERTKPQIESLICQLKKAEKIPSICFLLFLQFLPKDKIQEFLQKLKFDTKTIRQINAMALYKDEEVPTAKTEIKRLASLLGEENFLLLMKLQWAKGNSKAEAAMQIYQEAKKQKECIYLKDLAVNGGDILSLGVEKGKKVGEILSILLNLALEEPARNEKQFLLGYVKENYL